MDDLVEWANTSLPCYGIVSKRSEPGQDNFWYLALPEEWHQAEETLIKHAETLYQYDKNLKNSIHKLIKTLKDRGATNVPTADQATFFRCPGHVGPHISIGKHALGERVDFRVTKTMRYANQKMGEASSFDPKKYVAEWVALRVDLDENSGVQQVSSPHVSIAAFGFHQNITFPQKSDQKKNKRKWFWPTFIFHPFLHSAVATFE